MNITTTELIKTIQQHTDWVDATTLAEYFDVSTRTIRKRIKEINESHPNLIISSYKGYKFNESDYKDDQFENDDDLTSRSEFIIRKLLSSTKPVSVYDIADELYISDSSFERSLKVSKSMLQSFNLSIERKRNHITLTGTERNKRKLINYLISKENQGSFFIENEITNNYLSSSIDTDDISNILSTIFKDEDIFINDYGMNTILFHVIIMLDRVLSGQYVTQDDFDYSYHNQRVMQKIEESFNQKFNIKLPKNELNYLSIIISNNTNNFSFENVDINNIDNYIEKEYIELSKKICTELSNSYSLDFLDDNFLVNITIHLKHLISRAKYGSYTHNPLTKNFKDRFPIVYDMATFVIKEINDYLNVRIIDDEIAFIAFHIGSYLENKKNIKDKIDVAYVYSEYHNLHNNVLNTITKQFEGDINISEIIPINNYNPDNVKADIIISTATIDAKSPLICVGLFLTDEDIKNIRNQIDLIKIARKKNKLKKDLSSFIHKELFKKEYYCQDNIEMIKNLSEECINLGLCDKSFTEDVLERESLSCTSFRNGIAIPHSLKTYSNKSFISVVVNRKKMLWGSNYVNIIIMLGTANTDRERFKNVYNQLAQVLYEPANVRILSKCETYEEFIEKIIALT